MQTQKFDQSKDDTSLSANVITARGTVNEVTMTSDQNTIPPDNPMDKQCYNLRENPRLDYKALPCGILDLSALIAQETSDPLKSFKEAMSRPDWD